MKEPESAKGRATGPNDPALVASGDFACSCGKWYCPKAARHNRVKGAGFIPKGTRPKVKAWRIVKEE